MPQDMINRFIIVLIASMLVMIVDYTSLFSYVYTLLLIMLVNRITKEANGISPFWAFHFYLLFAVLFYAWQKLAVPADLGLSGQINGAADDTIYYSVFSLKVKPYFCSWAGDSYTFVDFLEFIYPFKIYTPLNIVIVNLLGTAFLPVYTYSLSLELFKSRQIAKRSAVLLLACPFIIYYGCIILRDIWVVTLVIASLYYFLTRKYMPFIIAISILAFLRLGSVIFIVAPVFLYLIYEFQSKFKNRVAGILISISFLGAFATICFIALFPYIQELTNGKLEDGLIRQSFMIKLLQMDSNTFLVKLLVLPFPMNVLSLTAFFMLNPFLSLTFSLETVLHPLPIFTKVLTPIFLFTILPAMFRSMLQGIFSPSCKNLRLLIWMVIIIAFLLGTISLQIRHKTVLIPFMCILSAYGMFTPVRSIYSTLGNTMAVIIILLEILLVK